MHTLSQMDPDLHREVLRMRAQVWDDLIAAFTAAWDGLFQPRWTREDRVSVEDIHADLAYGRE